MMLSPHQAQPQKQRGPSAGSTHTSTSSGATAPPAGNNKPQLPPMLQVLGEEQFQRIRNIMMAQQRTFVQQLYELHKLDQLQKLLTYEVLGYEQGVGLPVYSQSTPLLPTGAEHEMQSAAAYPQLFIAPLSGVPPPNVREEVETSHEAWTLPKAHLGATPPLQHHHHHHLQVHHHQHTHQHEHVAHHFPATEAAGSNAVLARQHPSAANLHLGMQRTGSVHADSAPHAPAHPLGVHKPACVRAQQAGGFRALPKQQQQQQQQHKCPTPQSSRGVVEGGAACGEQGNAMECGAAGSAATAKASTSSVPASKPLDICQLHNIPSSLRCRSEEACKPDTAHSGGSAHAPETARSIGSPSAAHASADAYTHTAAEKQSINHHNPVVTGERTRARASTCAGSHRTASSWPATPAPMVPPMAEKQSANHQIAPPAGSARARCARVHSPPSLPTAEGSTAAAAGGCGASAAAAAAGEGSSAQHSGRGGAGDGGEEEVGDKGGLLKPQPNKAAGANGAAQGAAATDGMSSMASWHALMLDKDKAAAAEDGADKQQQQQQQQQQQHCASAPNPQAHMDAAVALAGPKARAFRPTQSTPGLQCMPSTATDVCGPTRAPDTSNTAAHVAAEDSISAAAATAAQQQTQAEAQTCAAHVLEQPLPRTRSAEDSISAAAATAAQQQHAQAEAQACAARMLEQQQQQQPQQPGKRANAARDAPTTCTNVFNTGLYTAIAGAAAGATSAAAAAAGGGNRACGGSDHQRGGLRSSPQANVEITPQVGDAGSTQQALVQTASLRSRHSSPPTAECAGPGRVRTPVPLTNVGWPPLFQAATILLPNASLQQQQQQQQMDSKSFGLLLGECERGVASAPTDLQWWGGNSSTGGSMVPSLLAQQGCHPSVSEGMQVGGKGACAPFPAAGVAEMARKRTRLEGGRASYDAAVGQQLQQQEHLREPEEKTSTFQATVARKGRSKRGSTTRFSGESVCSDSSMNHQGPSRAAGSVNGRGSLDTTGNVVAGSSVRGPTRAGSGALGTDCVSEGSGGGSAKLQPQEQQQQQQQPLQQLMMQLQGGGSKQQHQQPQQPKRRQQRRGPGACWSRTGGEMEAAARGAHHASPPEKAHITHHASHHAHHASPPEKAHASYKRGATAAGMQQQGEDKQKVGANTAESDSSMEAPPAEGADQSAAGILLALSSGGTFN